MGGVTRPRHHHAILVQQQAECAADHPAMIREACAADLLGAAALTHGVEQLDAVGVDDPEHGWGGQEDLGPVLMGLQQTQEPRPLRKAGKQRPIVAGQPPIKRPVADTFAGMQQPQGDHLTGPEARLGMCGDGAQLVLDLREQGGEKVHGGHTALLSGEGCHTDQRGGVV